MRPLGLPRWAPHPMTGVRLRKRKEDRHREGGHVKMEAEVNPMQPQAKDTWSHQKLDKARQDSPLKASEKYSCLALKNCERINSCSKPPRLWCFVTAAPENAYSCFGTTTANPSSCSRDCMAHKPKIFTLHVCRPLIEHCPFYMVDDSTPPYLLGKK